MQATGREARVEARIARREEARAREASPELLTLPGGGDILGGGGDSFQAALARQRRAEAFKAQRQVSPTSSCVSAFDTCFTCEGLLQQLCACTRTVSTGDMPNDGVPHRPPLCLSAQASKSAVMQDRLNAFNQAEEAKMAAFRALIANAAPEGRITIPKRE